MIRADATGFTRATVRPVLVTFTRLGFATREDRLFRLTAKVMRLGYGYMSSSLWWEHSVALTFNVGARLPGYPISLGRVLLAALPDAVRDGCARR
ncbi:hypothetical protein ACFV2X_44515 [Streptomyces sp. NPDC059679]|uniref:hypothetical protein n=1 Tax=Streptomyces sp. NPDC059679 TaxID=3346903 RepID=UPI0036846AD6